MASIISVDDPRYISSYIYYNYYFTVNVVALSFCVVCNRYS